MTDLVVLSLEPWDEVWRRNQHLLAGLLRTDSSLRVLLIEPAPDPLHAVRSGRRPTFGRGLKPIALEGAEGRLWAYQPTKWLPRRLDPGQDARFGRRVARLAAKLGFSDPLLWVNDPSGAEVLRHTGWRAVYDITDDWLEADRTPAEHERLVQDENYLMANCAEVVVCSPGLVETKSPVRPVTLVQNAVDVPFYRTPQPRPADLPDGPVALYLGTIHTDRIDLDLCVRTARAIAGTDTLVLVGPAPLSNEDDQRLRDAGVVLLGRKHRDEVPGYLQHADVLVVPHVVTPFTDSLDPIKLYEYAAVGRSVVSTPVAGFRDSDDPQVTSVVADEFPDAVLAHLPAAFRFPQGADRHVATWTDRVDEMAAVIDRVAAVDSEPKPLTLVVDALNAPAESGGMRTYAESLVGAWHSAPGASRDRLIVHGPPWISEAFAGLPGVECRIAPATRAGRLTAQWFRTAAIFHSEGADAVLSLSPVVTGLVPREVRACVVHDWRHLRRPEEFSRAATLYRKLWLPSIRSAGAVFAISEKTARETVEQAPGARVHVVRNGTDHLQANHDTVTPLETEGRPLVVTFGHRRHKRPELVIDAVAQIIADTPCELVVLGADEDYAGELMTRGHNLGLSGSLRVPGFVSDEEYRAFMRSAHVVVIASTDEGFGLPVVEAAGAGAHVVVTTDSGLGEIHEELVLVAEPSTRALALAIARCVGQPRRARLTQTWAWRDAVSEMRRWIQVSRGASSRGRFL